MNNALGKSDGSAKNPPGCRLLRCKRLTSLFSGNSRKYFELVKIGVWVFLAYGYCATAFAGDGKEYRTGQTGNFQGRVEVDPGSRSGKQQSSYFHEHGYTRLDIPKGHYPPPGECRIWYPDQPAGQQPPPGDCRKLRGKVPPGGWLITNSGDDPKHVHIHVYDERKPNTIKVTGEFEIGSGIFVRVVGGR